MMKKRRRNAARIKAEQRQITFNRRSDRAAKEEGEWKRDLEKES